MNYQINRDVRDADIRQATERRRADDAKIMAKVNAVNREAFVTKFPGQIEHSMRLVAERLANLLYKGPDVVLNDPMTWPGSATEIAALSQSLWHLEQVRQAWPTQE